MEEVKQKKKSNAVMEEFNPTSIGLPANFKLTDYSKLKG